MSRRRLVRWRPHAWLLALAALLPAATCSRTVYVASPVDYVSPFIGTGTPSGQTDDQGGITHPGAAYPFGMFQYSPVTDHGPTSAQGTYLYSDDQITQFGVIHMSGAGCVVRGNFKFMPMTGTPGGDIVADWDAHDLVFSHADEAASPGSYEVVGTDAANNEVGVALTATRRTLFAKLSFASSVGSVLLGHPTDSQQHFQVFDGTKAEGYTTVGDFCNRGKYFRYYYAIEFSEPYQSFATYHYPGNLVVGDPSATGSGPIGGYVRFDTSDGGPIYMKIGFSFVSQENAWENLDAESSGWDFDAVKSSTRSTWNDLLKRVRVGFPSAAALAAAQGDLTRFYTALYHVFLHPNVSSDVDGSYVGYDEAVHVASDRVLYQNYSGWDVYRCWIQLMSVLAPEETADIAQSLVLDGEQGGALPRWGHQNQETGIMSGDPGPIMVGSAYAFGVHDFDTASALELMDAAGSVPGTTSQDIEIRADLTEYLSYGYIPDEITYRGNPESVSHTLEYATTDFAISQFALALGDTTKYDTYTARTGHWRNVFNDVSAWAHQRSQNGNFSGSFDPASDDGFAQGSSAQYTWNVLWDMRGLLDWMGGDAVAAQRLDRYFTQLLAGRTSKYFHIGNQVGYATPWAYDFAGKPYETQALVSRIIDEQFGTGADGLPGNDDLGSESSWLVWAYLGMYPAIPGTDVLALHGPRFPVVDVAVAGSKTLHLRGSGAGSGSPYVQSAMLNGVELARPWLDFEDDVLDAANPVLWFSMGSSPAQSWGSDPDDAPPSFPDGTSHPAPAELGTNLALGRPATGGSACASDETAAQAVDGSLDSKWCSHTWWLQVDLGSVQTIDTIVIEHAGMGGEKTDWNTSAYNLQVSTNGTSFTTVKSVPSNFASRSVDSFTPVSARYVKLDIGDPAVGNSAARIYELEVYAPN